MDPCASLGDKVLSGGSMAMSAAGPGPKSLYEGLGKAGKKVLGAGKKVPRGTAQVTPRVANTANHVFGPKSLVKHKLGDVLDAFEGDRVAAFNALEGAAQQLANQGLKPPLVELHEDGSSALKVEVVTQR